jgi:hypothetical protein
MTLSGNVCGRNGCAPIPRVKKKWRPLLLSSCFCWIGVYNWCYNFTATLWLQLNVFYWRKHGDCKYQLCTNDFKWECLWLLWGFGLRGSHYSSSQTEFSWKQFLNAFDLRVWQFHFCCVAFRLPSHTQGQVCGPDTQQCRQYLLFRTNLDFNDLVSQRQNCWRTAASFSWKIWPWNGGLESCGSWQFCQFQLMMCNISAAKASWQNQVRDRCTTMYFNGFTRHPAYAPKIASTRRHRASWSLLGSIPPWIDSPFPRNGHIKLIYSCHCGNLYQIWKCISCHQVPKKWFMSGVNRVIRHNTNPLCFFPPCSLIAKVVLHRAIVQRDSSVRTCQLQKEWRIDRTVTWCLHASCCERKTMTFMHSAA